MSPEATCAWLGISSLTSTFENFKVVPGAKDAFRASKLIATLETEWKLLLIYGKWGSGKTHLLEAIALEIWRRGYSVKVQTFPDFVSRLKETFDRSGNPGDTSFEEIMTQFCSMPYLLLDDVGIAGSVSQFSFDQLERVMLSRYRANLLTVITSNLDYAKLPPFVTSRFSDGEKGRMVLNEAPDYRPQKMPTKLKEVSK